MIGLLLSVAACSNSTSNLYPGNWFSGFGGTPDTLEPRGGYANAYKDFRPLASQVTKLSVERSTVGIVITAIGVMPTQGWYDGTLSRVEKDNTSEAIYEFHATKPLGSPPTGAVRTREIIAGAFLSNDEAVGLRSIRVISASNSLTRNR